MANVRLSTPTRNALANQITALTDAGAAAGTLNVYSGTQPATGDDAITGTLLATFTLTDPALAAAAAGVATFDFDPDLEATVAADGTASHFRIADSNGATVLDGDVATSGATLNFDSVIWTNGGTVKLATGTVTAPAS
jgi:hypothetical protein